MRIALVSPAGAGSRAGNRHTALRWAGILRAAGHRVALSNGGWAPGDSVDLMLALHARRSHAAIRAFADAHPGKPLAVALTGTDVYRDIRISTEAEESLELASGLIVLQPRAIDELAERLQPKARVVYQSSSSRLRHAPVKRGFRCCVLGHLRVEKDPLRTLAALKHLAPEPRIEVLQVGAALDEQLAREARRAMACEARYRWLGSVPHARALRLLAGSHTMVISSRMEGGANVVSEAARIGVPVLASRIPGNVGLLGEAYPGYFEPEDDRALGDLILRSATHAGFYRELKRLIARLRPRFAPENEARMLLSALNAAASAARA